MFKFFRGLWSSSERRAGRKGNALSGGMRLNYECLESRRLLFAASVIEDWPDWQSPLAAEPIFAVPAVGMPAVGMPAVNVSLEVRPGTLPIGRSILERATLLPLPLPADSGGGFYWPEISGEETSAPPPHVEDPDSSAPGGLVEMGDFEAQPASPLTEGMPDREASEVLALLAALQYVPRGEHAVSEDVLERLAADAARLSTSQPAGSAELDPLRSEGGMVGLVREALIETRSETGEGGGDDVLRPDEQTGIESIPGRYQAFEVSTVEIAPNSVAALGMRGAQAAARMEIPAGQDETWEDRAWEGRVCKGSEADVEELAEARGEVVALLAGEEANASNVGPDMSRGASSVESSGPMFEPVEAGTSRTLRAAAAFVFLLYSSRTARSMDVREPEQGRGVALRIRKN